MEHRGRLPLALDRRFEATVFDWDGTAVADRAANAGPLRALVEELSTLGFDLGVVTGTHVGNVDGQLGARPAGPGRLFLCVNRGSEVYEATAAGLELVLRREPTAQENAALDGAAEATRAMLSARGLEATVISDRLNRRKIDLIPEPAWADPPKARISELLEAVEERLRGVDIDGLREAVALAEEAAREAGLAAPRVTSDAKHVEIGLTDKADAARWVFGELARGGTGAGLVLLAGDEFGPLGGLPGSDSLLLVPEGASATAVSVGVEPTGVPAGVVALGGGPERFYELLRDQLARRQAGEVPELDDDPSWVIDVEGIEPDREGARESMLTLADGRVGTRGASLLDHPAADPATLVADHYTGDGAETELVRAPDWARLPGRLPETPPLRRRLDLRRGLLRHDGPYAALQFSSLGRPGTVALRVEGDGRRLPRAGRRVDHAGGITLALEDSRRGRRVDRLGAYGYDEASAVRDLEAAGEAGYEALLAEQRRTWAERWAHADVVIEGDTDLQQAVRFSLFHLMASVTDEGEAAVGARGLSGPAYRGHVFWDSDVFVLPFLAATHPAAARAMLEYRLRRLDAARDAAKREGYAGARFPWESARAGGDVTPRMARVATGQVARIRTGELEEHITADVAWAAVCYLDWTGDAAFAAGPGRELLTETARYWASRVRFLDGRAHIYGVIGPDEYHEPVDDNAFTNVMARWNLRAAAQLDGTGAERAEWLRVADALVDGYDPMSRVYEQFAGFSGLEPVIIADIAARPIDADLLLGRPRTSGAQVVKQPDVLMLHHLVPDEVASASLLPNLDYYEPRTAHGSSLSPAIHASLFARAGRLREAVHVLRIAAGLDLEGWNGTTAAGVHLATMGGVWQALTFGFAGIRPRGDVLVVDPRLPREWGALELRLRFRGSPFRVRIDRTGVELDGRDELELRRGDGVWEVVRR